MQSMLSHLHSLHLFNCSWATDTIAADFYSCCTEVQSLEFTGIDSCYMQVTMPKLKSFIMTECFINHQSVISLFKANPQLREIKIEECPRITGKILRRIVKYIPRIEKIHCNNISSVVNWAEDGKCLKQLSALKLLEIDCESESITPVINGIAETRVPLECLILHDFTLDNRLFAGIAELRQLNLLHIFSDDIVQQQVVGIIQNLSELTELTLRVRSGLNICKWSAGNYPECT